MCVCTREGGGGGRGGAGCFAVCSERHEEERKVGGEDVEAHGEGRSGYSGAGAAHLRQIMHRFPLYSVLFYIDSSGQVYP